MAKKLQEPASCVRAAIPIQVFNDRSFSFLINTHTIRANNLTAIIKLITLSQTNNASILTLKSQPLYTHVYQSGFIIYPYIQVGKTIIYGDSLKPIRNCIIWYAAYSMRQIIRELVSSHILIHSPPVGIAEPCSTQQTMCTTKKTRKGSEKHYILP